MTTSEIPLSPGQLWRSRAGHELRIGARTAQSHRRFVRIGNDPRTALSDRTIRGMIDDMRMLLIEPKEGRWGAK